MCIDAPESTTNYRSSGLFEDGASITHCSVGELNVVLSMFFELIDTFRQVQCFSTGAPLLLQGFVLRSFLKFRSTRIAFFEVQTFAHSPAMDPLFPVFHVVPHAFGELEGMIRSQFSQFPRKRLSKGNLGTRNPVEKTLSVRSTAPRYDLSLSNQCAYFIGSPSNLSGLPITLESTNPGCLCVVVDVCTCLARSSLSAWRTVAIVP